MYAKDLSLLLHQLLAEPGTYDDTLSRFESLRGYGLLPRGRGSAGVRLSDEQIAHAIIGFVPTWPRWAGHVALVLGDLRPVGGQLASFGGADTLAKSLAAALSDEEIGNRVVHVTLSIPRQSPGDEYSARIAFEIDGNRRTAAYVSKMAVSLLSEGADKRYDIEMPRARAQQQLVLSRALLSRVRRDVVLSRHLNMPLKTDWHEFENEEKKQQFYERLGARRGSVFLNLRVDTSVTWPSEPTRIKFGKNHFVLFPKTKDKSHSVSVDLAREKLTAEEARTAINRMLSVMSWCDNRYAVLHDGWSGNPVPVPVSRHDLAFSTTSTWLFDRSPPASEDLQQRLAYYREGLNAREAGIASYAVLSFYKVFEDRRRKKRNEPDPTEVWIASVFDTVCRSGRIRDLDQFDRDRGEKSAERYIVEKCRVATAHASSDHPSDADASSEIRRLLVASEIMRGDLYTSVTH